jgi:hypothetical protein
MATTKYPVKYQVWACYARGADELLEEFDHEHEADLVCNELNLAASDFPELDNADYRVYAQEVIPPYECEFEVVV